MPYAHVHMSMSVSNANRGLRWLRRLAVAGAALATIVACVIGLALLLVDTDGVKRAAERQFTQSVGGEASYESASLKLFPRPGVAFSGITIRVPGAVSGQIAGLHIRVAWLPLLYGEVRPTAVRIEGPVLEMRIAPRATGDPSQGYGAALGPLADGLARDSAGVSMAIEEGEITVAHGEQMLSFSGLQVAAQVSATDGRSAIRASVTGSAPRAAIARADRTVELGAVSVALDAGRDGDALMFELRDFRAGELVSGATGTLRAKADGTAPTLELRVPVLDLQRAGAAARALAGNLDAVREAFDGLQRGTLRDLTLNGEAHDLALLADPAALRVAGRVDAATVAVPGAGIVVENGSGRLLMADGVLQASELAGKIGRSSFSSGALAVAFVPGTSLRSFRGSFEADLADALAITKQVLRGHPEALADIVELQGRASAAIDYEAGRGASPLVADLKGIQATGRYRGVPVPFAVSRGDLHYTGDAVSVKGLAGSVGGSRLSKVAIDIVLGREPAIRAASGDATLLLDEIYPLIASLEPLRPLLGEIKSVTGTAAVHLTRLSGLFSRPKALEFDAAVTPGQVKLMSTALPGALTLAAGSVSGTPRALRLKGLQLALLDARITVSGTASNYAAPKLRGNLTLTQGSSGAKAIAWAGKQWKLPPGALLRAPVALSTGRVEWLEDAVAIQGTASIATGVQAQFDLAWLPGGFDLRRLALSDADSNAALRLQWSPVAAQLGFSGRLDHRTLGRSLAQPPQTHVMLDGDFRASIDLAEPHRSSADGSLRIDGLDLREYADMPVTMDRLNVDAMGRTLRVHDSVLRLAGERLAVSGTVEGGGKRLVVDGRIVADALDAAPILRAFSHDRPGKTPARDAWNLPVEGRVAIAATSVAYDGRLFKPMTAIVQLAPNSVIVDATDMRLCGIAIPFTATLTPGSVAVMARGTARNQALAGTVSCLWGDNLAATGTFDLDVELSASAPPAELLRAARGSFRVAARSGQIHRSNALSRALAVDEVAARTRTNHADMLARGLEYREITAAGSLEASRVRLERGMLDSPSLGITVSGEVDIGDESLELQGLVAPLDGIYRVIRRVPVLGGYSARPSSSFRSALPAGSPIPK